MSLPAIDKKKIQTRLRRAEGQLRAVSRMIDEGSPSTDTLVQITAIQGALGKIGELILSDHIESYVSDAIKNGNEDERQQSIDDLMNVLSRFGVR